jgi:hypothetical protein
LRFGALDPSSGKPLNQVDHLLKGSEKAAFIGNCIYFSGSDDVQILNLELDGNSGGLKLAAATKIAASTISMPVATSSNTSKPVANGALVLKASNTSIFKKPIQDLKSIFTGLI